MAVLGLSVVLLGACGGGDDDSNTDTAAGGTTTTAAASSNGGGNNVSGSFSTFCGFRGDFAAANPTPTGGDFKASIEAAAANMDRAVDASPSEIKSDMRIVANAVKEWAAELKRTNYNFMESAPKAESIFTSDVQAASQRINDWVTEHCK